MMSTLHRSPSWYHAMEAEKNPCTGKVQGFFRRSAKLRALQDLLQLRQEAVHVGLGGGEGGDEADGGMVCVGLAPELIGAPVSYTHLTLPTTERV